MIRNMKVAHEKYYLRFKSLGDCPSKDELLELVNAIHAGIRAGELTRETCDAKLVETMQRALIYALTDGKEFSFYRDMYFASYEAKKTAKAKDKPKEKVKVKVKTKTKAKVKVSKVKVKAKEQPKEKSKVQVTKVITLKPRSEITLKPSTELQCTLKASPKSTLNTYTQGTNSSTKSSTSSSIGSASREANLVKRAPITNRHGVKIRSAKSIAQQEYNFFKAGDFSKVFGEVAVPFSLMVSGVPGSGKTSFLLQLIKHVSKTYARHRLLFVSNEERFNPSLGTKLKRFDMLDCDNLDIADSLPSDLTDYDFIFLDSVQSLRLSVEDFKQQINQLTSAGICLFFVFQATKSGSFRGSLEYEHEVDISLKVEGGRATVVKNRFGGSGYYKIF